MKILDDILVESRETWPDVTDLRDMPTILSVILGDISRQARGHEEGDGIDFDQLRKELGNLIVTSIRFLDDFDMSPSRAVDDALAAQAAYAARLR